MHVTLSASLGWSFDTSQGDRAVFVMFGDTIIAALPPIRETRAGDGDDSSFFASEEQAIIEETVAPYLARIFGQGED